MMHHSKNKIVLLSIMIVLLLGGAALAVVTFLPKGTIQNDSSVPAAGAITIEGSIVCLPRIDLSGPQTLECAYGLLDMQARYFALRDSDSNYQNLITAPRDRIVEVTGTFTPEPSGEYRDIGYITVSQIK